MFAVAGGGIQNFEILHKFLNSDKAKKCKESRSAIPPTPSLRLTKSILNHLEPLNIIVIDVCIMYFLDL